jgi:S1-C subfamily serine protease
MVRVDQVVSGSAADRAGVLPGDFVLSLAGEKVIDVPTLSAALATRDGPTEVRLLRSGEVIDVVMDLGRE